MFRPGNSPYFRLIFLENFQKKNWSGIRILGQKQSGPPDLEKPSAGPSGPDFKDGLFPFIFYYWR